MHLPSCVCICTNPPNRYPIWPDQRGKKHISKLVLMRWRIVRHGSMWVKLSRASTASISVSADSLLCYYHFQWCDQYRWPSRQFGIVATGHARYSQWETPIMIFVVESNAMPYYPSFTIPPLAKVDWLELHHKVQNHQGCTADQLIGDFHSGWLDGLYEQHSLCWHLRIDSCSRVMFSAFNTDSSSWGNANTVFHT